MSGLPVIALKAAVAASAGLLLAASGLAANEGSSDIGNEVATILAIDGDLAFGNYLAGECATCHRRSGSSDGIPAIAGLDEETFVTAMIEYSADLRPNEVMRTTAKRLSHEEIAALAAHFSSLDAP